MSKCEWDELAWSFGYLTVELTDGENDRESILHRQARLTNSQRARDLYNEGLPKRSTFDERSQADA